MGIFKRHSNDLRCGRADYFANPAVKEILEAKGDIENIESKKISSLKEKRSHWLLFFCSKKVEVFLEDPLA